MSLPKPSSLSKIPIIEPISCPAPAHFVYIFYLFNRVEKEKNALQSEGDDLAVSLETLQKQKVSIFMGYPCLETGFLIAKHILWFFPRFSFQNQSDKQNRALEEQLSDNKYQVS